MEFEIKAFENHIYNFSINRNNFFLSIVSKFSFSLLSNANDDQFQNLNQTINSSKIIIIDDFEFSNQKYFTICFDKKLIIITKENISNLKIFFLNNEDSTIYILTEKEIKLSVLLNFQTGKQVLYKNEVFQAEIKEFNRYLCVGNAELQEFWSKIQSCISGYLIKSGYSESKKNRIQAYNYFFNYTEPLQFPKSDFIILRTIGQNNSALKLIYHIEKEKLYVLKIYNNSYESEKLFNREKENYLSVHHPFLLKCLGCIEYESNNCLILEFIQGQTLDLIKKKNLKIDEKLKIIFEIMAVIQYLHNQNYIYRDLKPDNLMLDQNKMTILIDLDRMVQNSDENTNENATELFHKFLSPEILNGQSFSFSTDIYSIGKIIFYMFEREFKQIKDDSDSENMLFLFNLYEKCTQKDPSKRPNIHQLIDDYYMNIYVKINNNNISEIDTIQSVENIHDNKYKYYFFWLAEQNDTISQLNLGLLYKKGDLLPRNISKALHYLSLAADKKQIDAQYKLGVLYEDDENPFKNIKKAIHYYSLASNQGDARAQVNLGTLYINGKYFPADVDKAIHYYSLAAKQGFADAYFNLGLIHHYGDCGYVDIKKAIDYYLLAAKQNHSGSFFNLGIIYEFKDVDKAIYYYSLASDLNYVEAQQKLGLIYLLGKIVSRDIDKGLHYLTLAAKQNYADAQFNLGLIYEEGEYVSKDIKRAINYFSLAANQNHPIAQLKLGVYYLVGGIVSKDINKGMYYLTLASNQNNAEAQYYLGDVYLTNEIIPQNINKAIHYLSLAASQMYPEALYDLGYIYEKGEYVKMDIDKAIHYYLLAANQNNSSAQLNLGVIYFKGQYVAQDFDKAVY